MAEKNNRSDTIKIVGFNLFFRQRRAGWSEYAIVLGNQFVHYVPSYLSHALGDFAAAAVKLASGEQYLRFSFEDEPGEYRWLIDSAGTDPKYGDLLRIQILEFEHQYSDVRDGIGYPAPDSEGAVRIDGVCTKRQFLLVAKTVLQEALAVNGIEGYRKKTIDHDFPEPELRDIERLTESPDNNN